MSGLQKGDIVPDVTLATASGTLTMAQLRGRAVVIPSYPKDDTSGCTREGRDFSLLKAAFELAGASVIGVSKDDAASHARFAAKHDLTVTLASDGDGAVCEAFGTWVEKSLYGRKYWGIDRATFLIDADGRVADVWRKVKVPGHADRVLAAAEALANR